MSVAMEKNFRRIGRLDIPGGGQIVVQDGYAYVGHMKPPHGTSIVDVRDPANPKLVTTIMLPDDHSHTHKVRVAGDIMIVNVEQNDRHALRRGMRIDEVRPKLARELGHEPSEAELSKALNMPEHLFPRLRHVMEHGYHDGGFRIYDIADKSNPRELAYVRTGGIGTHRFDADENYAYISTEMEGYVGNILVIYDLSDPARPQEVSRWWMPGQHVAGGETPTWPGQQKRLHHALRFGDEMWAAVWYAGIRILDVSDITAPKTIGAYEYHPPFPEPSHTFAPTPVLWNGRRTAVAVDEEHDHTPGQLHAGLWFFDVEDRSDIRPIGMYHLSDRENPFPDSGLRFGAHQFQERIKGDRLFCTWFAGGLRMLDISNPTLPREIGHVVPHPASGQKATQSNDVFVDERDLVHIIDRDVGLDIVEPTI